MVERPMYIGALYVVLAIPEARTLKDKRRVIRSVVDRLSHKFDVSCHLVGFGEQPARQGLLVTTGSQEQVHIQRAIDKMRAYLGNVRDAWPLECRTDVFPWTPQQRLMENLDGGFSE